MHGISQFYDKFLDKSPFKNNVEKPTKPVKKEEPKETPMSESEKKLMHATQSKTDKAIREQEYPGKVGVIIGEGAPEMSALNNVGGEITKPSYTGGYVGGGDIEGGYYVSTADMNEKIGKTLKKVGNAIGGSIEGAGKGKIGPGVADDAAASSDGVSTQFGDFLTKDKISGMF